MHIRLIKKIKASSQGIIEQESITGHADLKKALPEK